MSPHALAVSPAAVLGEDAPWLIAAILLVYVVFLFWSRGARRRARARETFAAGLDLGRVARTGLADEAELARIRQRMVGGMLGGAPRAAPASGRTAARGNAPVDLAALDALDRQYGREALATLLTEEELAAARAAQALRAATESGDPVVAFDRYRDVPLGARSPVPQPSARDVAEPALVPLRGAPSEPAPPAPAASPQRPGAPAEEPGSGATIDGAARLDAMLAAGVITRAEHAEMTAFYARQRAGRPLS